MPVYFGPNDTRQVLQDLKVQPIILGDTADRTTNAVGVCVGEHTVALSVKDADWIVAAIQSVRAVVGKANRQNSDDRHVSRSSAK